jgi:hypothetical protein
MGVAILNKDVSLISSITGKAKAIIANVGGITGWTGVDVTPNAVNWTDVSGGTSGQTNEQTISGISTSITLRIEFTGNLDTGNSMRMYINNTEILLTDDIVDNGFSNQTVNNNDVVYFSFSSFYGVASEQTTIKNSSDNNTILDTFIVDLAGDGGGG